MPKKYQISVKEAPPRFPPVGKYTTVEFCEDCAGSCRECVKDKCIYDVFKDYRKHISTMQQPQYIYDCQSCFRCVQECTRGIFSRVINPEYRTLGDDYWKADIIEQTWKQAQTGRIPVSGAGYGGPFASKGFDSMWTDMSEIVRPTRDGIHGREYINTTVELSRRPLRLEFGEDMSLVSETPPLLEIPLPLLFTLPDFGVLSENVSLAMVSAADELGTMLFISPNDYSDALKPYAKSLIPCLTKDNYDNYSHIINGSRMIEMADGSGIEAAIGEIRTKNPGLFISVSVRLNAEAAPRAVQLVAMDVDTLHFYADSNGNELDTPQPQFIKEMIRQVHLALVEKGIRQKINLLFSGGIAMAEHMAKAIICGADAITVDNPLLIALECRLCRRCQQGKTCPVKMGQIKADWGRQRIINLIGAWRNQLLEVMGAMGIREARRLRGEVGRSMWFEDLEKESFAPIFGERKVKGIL